MIPNIAQSPRGSRRPHTDGKVAAVRRLVETTLFTYGEISARTGVGRASICRWTRDGAWEPAFPARTLRGQLGIPGVGLDVDGKTFPARMDNNYSVVPLRPAGGMWTSARDLSKYLLMELALGALPDGTRLVSTESLVERRRPQIRMGEDTAYGMGLVIDTRYGIPVVSHGGSLFGYKSDMIFLPDHGVGAVVLANADTGGFLTGLLRRRLLEVLFDGKPEAVEQARVTRAQRGSPTSPRTASDWSSRQTMRRPASSRPTTSHPRSARCASVCRKVRQSSILASGAARSLRDGMTMERRHSSPSTPRSAGSISWSARGTGSGL